MANTQECFRSQIFYGVRWLLQKISHPISSLQNKGIKFEWTTECEEKFNLLKELLTSAPILNIVGSNENFVVCTNACKEGLGGFLTQNGHDIGYESKNIKEH